MFETRIPRNNASRHDPKVIVSTPKQNRIPLGIVSVLARTMLAYERLAARRGRRPRACLRRAASTSLNPVDVISPTVTISPTPQRPTTPSPARRRQRGHSTDNHGRTGRRGPITGERHTRFVASAAISTRLPLLALRTPRPGPARDRWRRDLPSRSDGHLPLDVQDPAKRGLRGRLLGQGVWIGGPTTSMS